MLADAVALLIVALAAGYAAWKLMPSRARRGIARVLGYAARRSTALSPRQVARIELHLMRSGCGPCERCGGCEPSHRRSPDVL